MLVCDHLRFFVNRFFRGGTGVVRGGINVSVPQWPLPFRNDSVALFGSCFVSSGHGVLVGATGGTEIRAVTHLDVSSEDIEAAAATFRDVLV